MRARWRILPTSIRPTPRPLPDAQTQELRALLGRRQQLVGMRTAEQNRLGGDESDASRRTFQAHITWLNERLATLDDDLETLLRASPLWREHDDLLQSAPGIGPVCTRTLVLELPGVRDAQSPADRSVGGRGAARIATVGPSAGGGRCGEAARTCARCCT